MDLRKPREKWLIVSNAVERSGKIRFENVDKLSQQKPDSTWLKRHNKKQVLFQEERSENQRFIRTVMLQNC